MRPITASFAATIGLLTAVLTANSAPAAFAAPPVHIDGTRTGDIRTESRPVASNFSAITLLSSADVIVKQGSPASITVTGTDEEVRRTETTIKEGTLSIGWQDEGPKVSWKARGSQPALVITVVVPVVEALAVKSSGDLRVDGLLKGNGLAITLKGSGDLHLPQVEMRGEITTTVLGSGDVHLAGFCAHHQISLNGSGDIKAQALRATTATVRLTGSGDITVMADEKLDASVTGSGDVRYKGTPRELTKRVTGSGSVARL